MDVGDRGGVASSLQWINNCQACSELTTFKQWSPMLKLLPFLFFIFIVDDTLIYKFYVVKFVDTSGYTLHISTNLLTQLFNFITPLIKWTLIGNKQPTITRKLKKNKIKK